MTNEKISIIIPAYNMKNEIERCVNSVLAQTYVNIEVIIVNDGSTDDTLKTLQCLEKKDKRIRVIDKKNEGVTRARLTGVSTATGDWLGFVDGDDYIEPDMYERLIKNAQLYNADISHCGYQMVFPNRVNYYYNTGRIVKQDNVTGMKDLLEGTFIEPGLCNKLFCKKLFDALLHEDKMDLSIKNNEDLLMNFYLFKEAQNSVYEDFCPYHYIVRKNSAANKQINENILLDPIKVTRLLLRECKDSSNLYIVLKEKYIRQLIYLASIKATENKMLIKPNRRMARKELRKLLPEILINNSYDKKLKCMVLMSGICPDLYRIIHCVYEKLTGLDKIYEVE